MVGVFFSVIKISMFLLGLERKIGRGRGREDRGEGTDDLGTLVMNHRFRQSMFLWFHDKD